MDAGELEQARRELASVRTAMLEVLKSASERYPWAAPFVAAD